MEHPVSIVLPLAVALRPRVYDVFCFCFLETLSTATTVHRDWIYETFTVDREQLANIIALHLDFGILQRESLRRLIGTPRLVHLRDFQINANKRAVMLLNQITAKYANPKLQDLTTHYFVTNNSLRGYVRPEAGKSPRTLGVLIVISIL